MGSQNRFCDQCGKAVPSLDSEFCASCGSRLSAAKGEPTEEPTSKESTPHSASLESSSPREAVAGGGKKGALLPRIILAVISFLIGPIGLVVGLWYMLKRKEKGFGGLLLSLGLISVLIFMVLPSDNASDSGGPDSDGPTPIMTSRISQNAIDAIYAMSQDSLLGKYFAVLDVEDDSGLRLLRVTLEIKYVPGVTDIIEDFYSNAEVYTETVAKSTVELLDTYDIDMDISVWGRWILSPDEIVLLGSTRYDASRQSYTWERFVP